MNSTANGDPHNAEVDGEQLLLMERAVSLVQQHWRTRRRQVGRSTAVDTHVADQQLDHQPENTAEVVQLAKRICATAAKAHAARQIQKRWRRYREAVEALGALEADPQEAQALGASGPSQPCLVCNAVHEPCSSSTQRRSPRGSNRDLEDLCDFLEHNIFDSARALPPCCSSDDNDSDDDHDILSPVAAVRTAASNSPSRSAASRRDDDINSIIHSILSTAGDFEDELDSRDSMIQECAAIVIQRYVRRWQLRRRQASHREVGGNAGLSERVINALRVLQSRFRLQRIRRMVQDRDRNELVTRLQQLWRRRRELQRHFSALRRGREEAAARNIQRAYIRHRSKRQQGRDGEGGLVQQPDSVALRTTTVRAMTSVNTLPCCIICMSDVVQIAFLPCGHAHTCVECGSRCQRCPTCRKVVALQVRIYL